MSSRTDRQWRKQQLKEGLKRKAQEQEAKQRRLRGFAPATTGEMLSEIARRGGKR